MSGMATLEIFRNTVRNTTKKSKYVNFVAFEARRMDGSAKFIRIFVLKPHTNIYRRSFAFILESIFKYHIHNDKK